MSIGPYTDRLKPVHPGEVLREDFLIPLGITQSEFVLATGISRQHVGRLCRGLGSIDAPIALRIGRYFGTSPELWLLLQSDFDLDTSRAAQGDLIETEVIPHVYATK